VELFISSQESKMGGWYEASVRLREEEERKMEENNNSFVKSTIVGVTPKLIKLVLAIAGVAFLISRLPRD
jgi:hypothetical protein